jgi:hypothetical protein
MPILMVGAGLFFAGSKTGQAAAQKASDVASDLSDEASPIWRTSLSAMPVQP